MSIEYAPKLQELANLYSPSNVASTEARAKTGPRRLSNLVSPHADQNNAAVQTPKLNQIPAKVTRYFRIDDDGELLNFGESVMQNTAFSNMHDRKLAG